jgi:hypothetical protein
MQYFRTSGRTNVGTSSATCNGYHYWNLYFTGSNDQITFKNNYVHHFSGRAPKLGGNTVLHAVNNYVSNFQPIQSFVPPQFLYEKTKS